jgi:hypothetical protein
MEQAFAVMDASGDDPDEVSEVRVLQRLANSPTRQPLLLKFYPMDERQWLLGTSYNTGIECLQYVRFHVLES